jgi:hypothetical protein
VIEDDQGTINGVCGSELEVNDRLNNGHLCSGYVRAGHQVPAEVAVPDASAARRDPYAMAPLHRPAR